MRNFFLLLLTCSLLFSGAAGDAAGSEYVPGQIVVGLHSHARISALDAVNARYGAVVRTSIRAINAHLLEFSPSEDIDAVIGEYLKLADVRYAEPNYILHAQGVTPNDPRFGEQWGIPQTNLPQAWQITTGSSRIIAAVLDTGIEGSHEDLSGRVIAGYNFIDNNTNANDDHGHGTHVAGIIGANTNNGIGVAGASWGVKLMPVKVLSAEGWGPFFKVAQGIIFSVDNGAHIINLSLGGPSPSQALEDAVNNASGRGSVVFAATGNENGAIFYPAAYANAIAVGASNPADGRASFSNYGPQIDLVAPGTDILNTWIGNSYISIAGTSMATPLVSGIAALMLSVNPGLSPAQVREILNSTADGGAWNEHTGNGRVNAEKAVEASVVEPDPGPGPDPHRGYAPPFWRPGGEMERFF